MYGSASTWLFNVVRLVLAASSSQQVVSHFVSDEENFAGFGREGTVDLVKSHEISSEIAVLVLAALAETIFITVRDPRDAVVSLMQARSHSFERALHFVAASARLCKEFSGDARAQLYRYENGFFNDEQTVSAISTRLGHTLAEADRKRIFSTTSRSEVEKYIAKMACHPGILQDKLSGDLLDPQTQWHSHHAGRRGVTGRWREVLTSQQAQAVENLIPYFCRDAETGVKGYRKADI
jgi:hypothetical protein